MKTKFLSLSSKNRFQIVFLLTIALLLFFALTPRGYAQTTETSVTTETPQTFPYKKTFTISAYYSPLPDQRYFAQGNYEAEVRMEGEGVTAADGTKVYSGLAAASRDFPFGTKMEIPGFGIIAIHDRGGAINGDRLDIWVGYGEEGLSRSIGFGMRKVEVTVLGIDPAIKESVRFDGIPLADLTKLPQKTKYFKTDLNLGDSGLSVSELQRMFKKLGFFTGEITGNFGEETRKAVEQFQLNEKVIDSNADAGAGIFGPRTRGRFEALLAAKKAQTLLMLPQPPLLVGASGESVKQLQTLLQEYGFLKQAVAVNGEAVFDAATEEAVKRLQIDLSIIMSGTDAGAGIYGPKTKAALETLIAQNFTPMLNLPAAIAKPGPETAEEPTKPFTKTLTLGDRGPEVAGLQEELRRLHFLGVPATGYFGETTKHAVFKFQQAFAMVKDEKTPGAGEIGPQTLAKLNELALARAAQTKLIVETTEQRGILNARLADEKILLAGFVINFEFQNDLQYGNRGLEVEHLQRLLKKLGFFQGKITTEYFGDVTKEAVIAFQKSHSLGESGTVDNATRALMNNLAASPLSS